MLVFPPPGPGIKRVVVPPESTRPLPEQAEGERLKTARELRIMEAWPIEGSFCVTKDRLFVAPYNRWGLQHAEAILPTVAISRGDGPVAALPAGEAIDVDSVPFEDKDGKPVRVGDFFAATGLDGVIVLHRGKVVFERYENGMTRDRPHMMLGASAAFTGIVAAELLTEGKLAPETKLIDYLKYLEYSVWRDASVRSLLDMTASVRFGADRASPHPSAFGYAVACGLLSAPKDHVPPQNLVDFLKSVKEEEPPHREHGEAFEFLPIKVDVLAELVRAKERSSLAHSIEQRIWSRLGAEHDARMIVDSHGVDLAALGFVATVPDMARFAQMLLDRGHWNGQDVVPGVIALDLFAGGDATMFGRNEAASKLLPGGSYHAQWWNTAPEIGAAFLWGAQGQMVWIHPRSEVVIVRVSSHSREDSDFLRVNEIRAMEAIVKRVAEGN